MTKNLILVLLILQFALFSSAQKAPDLVSTPVANDAKDKPAHLAIGVMGGTLGYGPLIGLQLTKRLAISAAYTLGEVKGETSTSFDGSSVQVKVNANFQSIPLFIDISPRKRGAFAFRFGAVFQRNAINANALPVDSQSYGLIKFSPEETGQLNFRILQPEIMPYAGIVLGRAVPKHRLGFAMDLGAFYMGSPGVSISASKAFEPSANASNQQVLERALSDFKFYPFLNFRLTLKLF